MTTSYDLEDLYAQWLLAQKAMNDDSTNSHLPINNSNDTTPIGKPTNAADAFDPICKTAPDIRDAAQCPTAEDPFVPLGLFGDTSTRGQGGKGFSVISVIIPVIVAIVVVIALFIGLWCLKQKQKLCFAPKKQRQPEPTPTRNGKRSHHESTGAGGSGGGGGYDVVGRSRGNSGAAGKGSQLVANEERAAANGTSGGTNKSRPKFPRNSPQQQQQQQGQQQLPRDSSTSQNTSSIQLSGLNSSSVSTGLVEVHDQEATELPQGWKKVHNVQTGDYFFVNQDELISQRQNPNEGVVGDLNDLGFRPW